MALSSKNNTWSVDKILSRDKTMSNSFMTKHK